MASGREQRRQTPAAQIHAPNLSRFYRYPLPPLVPGNFEFVLELLRPGKPAFSLANMVENLEWVDEQATLTGSMTLHRPVREDPQSLPIGRGHLVRCRVLWGSQRYEVWTMRCDAPNTTVDQGTVDVTLQDEMALLERGKQDWIFRKTKRRPYGYTAGDITREVAARLGFKIRALPATSARFSLVKRRATPLAALRQAWSIEKTHSARSYVIRMRGGELEVGELRRNPLIYELADQIQTALITQKAGQSVPVTILTGRARVGKGKGAKKISYTALDRKVIGVLGAVRDTRDYGRVDSHKDLRDRVNRDLAKELRVNDTISIQHAGIPFILRGDGVMIDLPSEGYAGAQRFVYATRADHVVQAGTYTTNWDFTAADPFLKQQQADARAAAARAAKRAKRKRTVTKR